MDFEAIVQQAVDMGASDIHLAPGFPVFIRLHRQMQPMGEPISLKDVQDSLMSLLNDRAKETLKNKHQVDFLAKTQSGMRLRGNAFYQENGISAAFRIIPREIFNIDTLGFPDFVKEKLLNMKQGFVLVVGPTGQGKSTTLAAVLQRRLENRTEHLITIEDPIEYVIHPGKGLVQQREVGRDMIDFGEGVIASLREDPDVVMVGEMRDLDTISSALTMAETGHVVFSTLHTNDGPQTINRIIDVFAPDQQNQVRSQLASTLTMIISQRLVPTADGKGLTLAYEVLSTNYAIQNYIRQNKIYQIPNVLQTDSSGEMVQFEQSLAGLVLGGKITEEVALEYSQDKDLLKSIMRMASQ